MTIYLVRLQELPVSPTETHSCDKTPLHPENQTSVPLVSTVMMKQVRSSAL